MSKTHFGITIQTKPYLKKYLMTLYGDPFCSSAERSIIFKRDNHFGICISAFLHRDPSIKSHDSKQTLRLRVDRFDAQLQIQLPITFLTKRTGGHSITDQHTITLNKLFETRFEEDLWKLCMIMNICRVETKDAIEEFCKNYNIEIDQDITMDALVKKEYRYRKKMQNSAPDLSADNFNTSQKKFTKAAPVLSGGF